MEGIDAAKRETAAADDQAKATLAQVESETEALDKREADLATRLEERRTERSRVSEAIDARLLEQYEKIATRRRPVVVRITQEICLGCRVNIPPQLYIEILSCESLLTCANCHRILIHERCLDSAPK
jgi:predicted  nucleic acid-binding Zn-ribbon protein